MYRLTEEGKRYLEEGLPEERLVELLEDEGEVEVDEVNNKIDDSSIAINWGLKNGWIEMENGKAVLKENPGKSPLRKDLKAIDSDESMDKDRKDVLLERNLIEEIKEGVVKKAEEQLQEGEISELTPELIKTGLWREVELKKYDVKKTGKRINPGKKQAYRAFLDEVKEKLTNMGFQEMTGPAVEKEFANCDALYMPQNHPARGIHDLYYIKNPDKGDLEKFGKYVENIKNVHETGKSASSKGWNYSFSKEESKNLVLRSQGTAMSARMLMDDDLEVPGKYFGLGRVYRPDVVDASHLTEFNQLEGIVLAEDLNFRNLLGLLERFAKDIAGTDKVKFRPGYFPFTEPSVECYIYQEEMDEWVEVLGAGIFREEVTKPLGIDVPVLAWGIGIDRLFMIKEGIDDIRKLFSQDLEWLREVETCRKLM